MSFNINPCKAVMQKVKDSNCDINTMNDLCYEISNAYGNVYGLELKSNLDKRCKNLINEQKCIMGKKPIDNPRRPTPPPIFNQVPHFFPALFNQTNNPQKSYEQCSRMCEKSKYPNSCNINCKLDYDALEIENYDDSYYIIVDNTDSKNCDNTLTKNYDKTDTKNCDNTLTKNYDKIDTKEYDNDNTDKKIDYDGYKNAHPMVFFLGYAFVTFLFIILVFIFIRILIKK